MRGIRCSSFVTFTKNMDLINLNYVSEYSMSKVKMSDGKEIIIGKSRRKQFKDEFINHELMED